MAKSVEYSSLLTIGHKISSILAYPLIALIYLYRFTFSPIMGNSCRFHPTCSHYSEEALRKYGAIKGQRLRTEELPFLKRYPYQDEREFRVIYESTIDEREFLDITISLSCIDRIALSPWIPAALATDLESTIYDIKGCKRLKVVRSTVISNERWKNLAEDAR